MGKMSEPNYYEVLETHPAASFEELKRQYKKLVLQCHPDKIHIVNDLESSLDHVQKQYDFAVDDKTKKFFKIIEAWTTLKDIKKRQQYDAELLLENIIPQMNVFQEVTLNDMMCQKTEELTTYTLNCRCGGTYIFEDADMPENEDTEKLIIECSECSLVILIQINEQLHNS